MDSITVGATPAAIIGNAAKATPPVKKDAAIPAATKASPPATLPAPSNKAPVLLTLNFVLFCSNAALVLA
jgi:hypothetical protein